MSQSTAKSADPVTISIANYPLISDWLDFSTSGRVRARTGKVELGQGIDLALRSIVADALSVEMGRIDLVAGDTRESPNENYTAGSMSVELGGVSLRVAANAARARLLGRAGELLQADAADLEVVDGSIEGTGLDYWGLAAEVSLTCPVMDWHGAEGMKRRSAPATALVEGARARIRARLTGGAFIQDLNLPEMVHGRVLSLPNAQARLVALDTDAIAALPGVIDVYRNGSFVGVITSSETEAIAAIAKAENLAEWQMPERDARTARDMLNKPEPVEIMAGEETNAATDAPTITAKVTRPFLAHASIGTCCAIALWNDGKLLIWTHAQGSHPLRAGLSAALELPPESIEVVHVPGAGCYGHNGADDAAFEAALLARATPGRPVRLLWSRADELTRGWMASAMSTEVAVSVDNTGTISAMSVDVLSAPHQNRPGPGKPNFSSGPLLEPPVPHAPPSEPPPSNGGGSERNGVPPYSIPAIRVARRLVIDQPIRTSAMRALGAFNNVTAIELAMDVAAEAAGSDPLSFRLKHLDDPRAKAVLERVADLANFSTDAGETRAMGLGVSRYKNKAGYCAVCVEIEADLLLRATRLWAVADVGEAIDPEGVLAQVEGGAIQALSWSLKEEMPIEDGAPAAFEWESYPILRFSEIPETHMELLSDPAHPPLGAGEIAQGPTGAAVATAVRRIFGIDTIAFPLTFDRLTEQLLA